ncbi:NUDIX hydrolase [Azospirillum halopraeferens]|uniref:NUDIX hydrolase n=1 Tax=Azospirillum halopraeferens TaxID=34010 RepID=UPI000401CDEE|nr:NUDIX hydrolase [Azospirillum halopraeferens]
MGKREIRIQIAALPYRLVNGRAEILLVTSRDTGRWIIPKGWAEKGVPPHEMAAREAFEEAGVRGRVAGTPLGSYRYDKRLSARKSVPCEVFVFLLEVTEERRDWPEKGQRERRWMTPEEAGVAISEAGLVAMLLGIGRS